MHDLDPAHAAMEQLVSLPVADVERDLILPTLRQTGGNRTHAANLLGIAIRTLRNKINLYQVDGHEVPEPGQGPGRSGVLMPPSETSSASDLISSVTLASLLRCLVQKRMLKARHTRNLRDGAHVA